MCNLAPALRVLRAFLGMDEGSAIFLAHLILSPLYVCLPLQF